jgi:hydroxyacylglutathione hydrolase
MQVIPIPCLQDNYAYLVICSQAGEAAVVDPSEAIPVLQEVRSQGIKLTAILNTHHHWDHVGGNEQLIQKFPELRVIGHASDRRRIPGQNVFIEEGETFEVGRIQVSVTHNPGHTSGAISFYMEDAVFTGDTLFAAGCGRLFEGTPDQMYDSLHYKIGDHPLATKIYFGHEYTENNLRFAQTVEPSNSYVIEKLKMVKDLRRKGQVTTPSTLEEEFQTNPFMRCGSPEIRETVHSHDHDNDLSPASVLKVIRQLKDRF